MLVQKYIKFPLERILFLYYFSFKKNNFFLLFSLKKNYKYFLLPSSIKFQKHENQFVFSSITKTNLFLEKFITFFTF